MDIDMVKEIEATNTDNFVKLAEVLGLDPKNDFRNSNLSGVDLSNCDLRGWDFTNANLRGATGVNVIVDSTTIITGADVSGSIFSQPTE